MAKKKPGPAPIQINWETFEKLVSYQCTQREVADFFNCSVDTLDRACQRERGMHLADVWLQKRNLGRVRLRKSMFDIIERGGPGAATMAIFTYKTMFGDPSAPEAPLNENDSQLAPADEPKKTFEQFCIDAGYPKPFPKQVAMKDFLLYEFDPRLLLGARGYGKTDYMTVLGVAYDVYLNGVNTTNLIITKSKARNVAIIEEIAQALIKNGVVLDKANSTHIRVAGLIGKDHSVEVLTIKSSFRGRHPKRTVMDDPVTEEDTSEAMRSLVKKKYDEAYKLCKNVCIIGQPAHEFDLYGELREIILKMELPHGTIPELDADLDAMKLAGVDEKSIQMSYHLKIPKDGSSIFSNLKYIDALPSGDKIAFIDPSDGGDYTATTIFRGYFDGIAVQGKLWRKAWYHTLDELVPFLVETGVKIVYFETNSTGDQPIEQLRSILKEHGISVRKSYSTTNKHSTIVAAGNYAHMIHLSKQSDVAYTKQVTTYEYKAKHDDAPDSLARGLEVLGLIRGKK